MPLYLSVPEYNTDRFTWVRYDTRPITMAGKKRFSELILSESWDDLYREISSTTMAEILDWKLQQWTNECFPVKHIKIRSTDDPWITWKIRKRIEDRKRIYRRLNKRTEEWKEVKKETDRMIKGEKKAFLINLKKKRSKNVTRLCIIKL